jgi:YesN/AraC family two-component response regulator
MYHLLIVDDEILAIKGLEAGVRWKLLGVSQTYSARNIRQAKEIFRNNRVDIVLCDIELCQENGLDLIEWVNQHYEGVRSVILSCHADFTYAQRALRLGTADYVVKALTYEELEDVIAQIVRDMENPQHQTRDDDALNSSEPDIIDEVQRFIIQHIKTGVSRKEISDFVHLNSDYLNRLFKKEMGMTLMDYYQQERMIYAKKLLSQMDMTVSKAAAILGYSNFSHFARAFKRATGLNPTDCKKNSKLEVLSESIPLES